MEVSDAIQGSGVLVGHANARLTVHGRRLAVDRVLAGHRVADVASQLGCSRTTIYKWVARFRAEGGGGLIERSSRPHRSPTRTDAGLVARIIRLRTECRRGQDWIAAELQISARTVGRVISRAGLPRLCELDAITGQQVRRGPASRQRYERAQAGELIHIDVKKLGRIPEGGGWRIHGRAHRPSRLRGAGFDYVHSAIDDHTRLAYTEIHPDERGVTCAEFLERAAVFFAAHGIDRIQRVMTDNAFAYRHSNAFAQVIAELEARQIFIRPHCPWTNGKVERFNRTLLREWAYAQMFTTNDHRAQALQHWLEYYNHRRRHSSLGGHPPISRLPTTC